MDCLTTYRRTATMVVAALTFSLLGACVGEDESTTDSEGWITVTPEIQVEGLDNLNQGVVVEDLYLGIGEIRFEPLENEDEVVYVTRSPMFLHFDLADDVATLQGLPILLPNDGDYLISVRIDPVSSGMDESFAMKINGMAASFSEDSARLDATQADIEPTPLPMRTTDGEGPDPEAPIRWIPWTYESARTVNLVLNDVSFDTSAEQTLVIHFDLSNWISEALGPIAEEIEASRDQKLGDGDELRGAPVDVTTSVDEATNDVAEEVEAWSVALSK